MQSVATTQTKLSDNAIDQLFAEMNAVYGKRWRANFPDEKSLNIGKTKWSQMLSGLTKKQLRRGVDSCAKLSGWDPTISEFLRSACDLPTRQQCISRVLDGKNIDPISYKITGSIGTYALKRMTMDQANREISNRYDDVYQDALNESVGVDCEFNAGDAIAIADYVKPDEKEFVRDEAAATESLSNIRKMMRSK